MRRTIEGLRRQMGGARRVAAGFLAAALLVLLMGTVALGHRVVTIADSNGNSKTLLTTSEVPEQLIEQAGFEVGAHDEVVYAASGQNAATVLIRRAFPVALMVDGQRRTAQFVEGTVADLLAACGVKVTGEDFVEPAPGTALTEDLTAKVHRVTYTEETTREEVGEAEVGNYMKALYKADPESPFRQSNSGIYDVTWRHRLVDGEVESSEIVSLVPVITPRDPGSYEFIAGVPCSRINSFDGVEMGIDGLPMNYTRLWQGAVCTAYSSSGGRGSSGLGLYCGTVAVNPNIIPYGTRMFITSADQSFVYGFAIATDTGTAMMEGYVDLDLYFETNAECYRFGKRQLNVYILD